MHDIDISSPREQRKFGLTMAVALALFGAVRWWWNGAPSPVLFTTAIVFCLAALAAPFALRPVFWLWMKLAEAMNWVMTRVLLSLVFFGLITPARYLNQFFGSDPLKRDWLPEAASYWEEPDDQPASRDAYRNQF